MALGQNAAAKAPDQKHLDDLPNEILGKCFECLQPAKEDIQNLRLASKRCNTISSRLLIDSTTVYITSSSLSRFEEISRHPVFSKSIKDYKINVSYYDVKLAEDRGLFGEHCGSNLYRSLESHARGAAFNGKDDGEEDLTARLWPVSDEWRVIGSRTHLEETCTETERLLLDGHSQYKALYLDQEQVKLGGAHIQRICAALERFLNVESVAIDDSPYYSRRLWPRAFCDKELMEDCLRPSEWKGSFITAPLTSPPVEIIPTLFQALRQTEIRPTKLSIRITPPFNLRCMQLSEPERQAVRIVVSKSRHLVCKVGRWARKDSLAENNSRPREEMLALCSLTSTFFNAPNLTTLELILDEYPAFHEPPQVSLADLLPLNEKSWNHLENISLRSPPCRTEEFRVLVTALRRVENFEMTSPWLLEGQWTDALTNLKGFEVLKKVIFKYPQGGGLGELDSYGPEFPTKEICQYLTGLRNDNPLQGFNSQID